MAEKISFIHIPKNAGTSMQILCRDNSSRFEYCGHDVDVFKVGVGNQMVVLQCPVERFKSAVRYAVSVWGNEPHLKVLIDRGVCTPEQWVNVLRDRGHPLFYNVMLEVRNISHFIGKRRLLYKWTYSPQSFYINNPRYVLLIENLTHEVGVLLSGMGIDYEVPRENVTNKNSENNSLSPGNIEWLRRIYEADVNLFERYSRMPLSARLNLRY